MRQHVKYKGGSYDLTKVLKPTPTEILLLTYAFKEYLFFSPIILNSVHMRKMTDKQNRYMLTLKSAFLKTSSEVTSNWYLLGDFRIPGLVRSRSCRKPLSILVRQHIEHTVRKHKYFGTSIYLLQYTAIEQSHDIYWGRKTKMTIMPASTKIHRQ